MVERVIPEVLSGTTNRGSYSFFSGSQSVKTSEKAGAGKKARRQVYRCPNNSNCCAPRVRCYFPAHAFPLFSSNLEPSSTSLCSCSSVWFIWMDTTLLQVLGYETNCLKNRLWEKWKKARSTSDTNFSSKVIENSNILFSLIGWYENMHHPVQQSDAELRLIATWSWMFCDSAICKWVLLYLALG